VRYSKVPPLKYTQVLKVRVEEPYAGVVGGRDRERRAMKTEGSNKSRDNVSRMESGRHMKESER
jgi:hypothetical protein